MEPGSIQYLEAGESIVFPRKKFEQVAMYVPHIDEAKHQYYKQFGITDWKEDTVTATGWIGINNNDVRSKLCLMTNVARLAFNYDLGFELELIHYVAGKNWHHERGRIDEHGDCSKAFASHMSYHVEDMEGAIVKFEKSGLKVIQNVTTISHTNPYLLEKKRKYNYAIFDSRELLGFDLKLIKRIE